MHQSAGYTAVSEPPPFRYRSNRPWAEIRNVCRKPVVLRHRLELDCFRHGETVTNASGLVTGASDVDLTPNGWNQARELGNELRGSYDCAFSSTLRRSRETLALALEVRQIPVHYRFQEARLAERCLGVLEQRPAKRIPELTHGDLTFAPEGGESYLEVARRTMDFLLDLFAWSTETRSTRIALCGHMGPMRMLLGIIDTSNNASAVLAENFENARIINRELSRITIPPFIQSYL